MEDCFKCLLLLVDTAGIQNISAQKNNTAKPNIVRIVCEDISPFISCYGDKVVKTPNIDQFAKEGVR